MKNQIKVSVIIPVYNAEKYIEQCIHSVLSQELKELEIVCVDDGSTDRSAEVVSEIASIDQRVTFIQQKNQGPGAARNLAIKNAHGKYVSFLDADDYYLDKDALKKMYRACERENTSVSMGVRWCVNGYLIERGPFSQKENGNTTIDYLNYQMDYDYICYLFLRKLLMENEIWFPLYYRFQDPPFLVKALYEAKKISVVDTCLYYYRLPVVSKRFDKKKTADLLRGLMDNLQFSQKNQLEILFRKTVWRLEHEYADIICSHLCPENMELLELLMRANQIVQQGINQKEYMIRPLRLLLFKQKQYEKFIIGEINKQEEIVLYGAGKFGTVFLHFIEKNGLTDKVTKAVVSQLKEKNQKWNGIPVISLEDLPREGKARVFVTVGEEYQKEIEDHLIQNGYSNYMVVREEFLHLLEEEC